MEMSVLGSAEIKSVFKRIVCLYGCIAALKRKVMNGSISAKFAKTLVKPVGYRCMRCIFQTIY